MQKTNEQVKLEISAPLLRPGLKLIVGPFSKKYARIALEDAMEIIRAFNSREADDG